MPNCIRPKQAGASVFFTVALAERGSQLLIREIETLRAAVRQTRTTRPFRIDAWVVLPDHMHCVWTLPPDDADYSGRMGQIKAAFSKALPAGDLRASHIVRREKGIWQRRFWEHHARSDADFDACVEYCWDNPVKHGLVQDVADWPYSSWHRDRPDA
jgi:putative transposase